jgi:hypothetical protein
MNENTRIGMPATTDSAESFRIQQIRAQRAVFHSMVEALVNELGRRKSDPLACTSASIERRDFSFDLSRKPPRSELIPVWGF